MEKKKKNQNKLLRKWSPKYLSFKFEFLSFVTTDSEDIITILVSSPYGEDAG